MPIPLCLPRRACSTFASWLLLPLLASGASLEFLPDEGEWSVAGNWSGGHVPSPSDTAAVGNERIAVVAKETLATANSTEIGTSGQRGTLRIEGTLRTSMTNVPRGFVTMAGGSLLLTGQLRIGGHESSLQQEGGTIQAAHVQIHDAATVTIHGGEWRTTGAFVLGIGKSNYPSTLNLWGGALFSDVVQIGSAGTGTGDGIASVEGGRWDIESRLHIGGEGRGELRIVDGGVVSVGKGKGPVFLGDGMLLIDRGGSFTAGEISGDSRSELRFDHAEEMQWTPRISGGIRVNHYGHGTTVINGFNLYSGQTTITSGTLLVRNEQGSATGTSAVRVGGNGTLAGFGAIEGNVSLEESGTIRPSGGDLRLGSLTWNSGSLALEVGPGASKLLIEGALRKGEGDLYRIEMSDEGAVIGETYTLVEFDSTDLRAADFHVHGRGNLVVTESALQWTPTGPPPPASRSVAVNARRGAGKTAIFTITNTGNVEDRYRLRAHRRVLPESSGSGKNGKGQRRIECRYFLNGAGISDALERGPAFTGVFPAGGSATLRVSVQVRSPVKSRKRLVSEIIAQSVAETTVAGKAATGIRLDVK